MYFSLCLVAALYTGSSDLQGVRVWSTNGRAIASAAATRHCPDSICTAAYWKAHNSSIAALGSNVVVLHVQVLSAVATFNFQSRKSGGTHVYATYTTSVHCPDGYMAPEAGTSELSCMPVYVVASGVLSAVHAISAVAIALVCAFLLLVVKHMDSVLSEHITCTSYYHISDACIVWCTVGPVPCLFPMLHLISCCAHL